MSHSSGEQQRWLKSLAHTGAHWTRLSIVLGLASGTLLIAQAHLLAAIVHDTLFTGEDFADQWGRAGLFAGALLLRALMSPMREWAGQQSSTLVRREVRQQLLRKLETLGPAYTSGERSGQLVGELMEQVEALNGFFARYLPQMALAALLPLVFLAFIFPVNWAAGLIFLITAPLIPLFMALVGMKAADANRQNFEALSLLGAQFLDIVQGILTLKLFDRSRDQVAVVESGAEIFRERTMQVLRLAFLSSAVLEFFASVSIALIAVYLGFSFLGHLDFGYWDSPITLYQGLFILLLAPEFYLPLRELGTHYHAKQEAVAAADRLRTLLEQESDALPAEGEGLSGPVKEVSIRQACLVYPGHGQAVWDGLDLTLVPGRLVALVGRSGSGKSSLLQALLGFRSLASGEIRVNGQLLSDIGTEAWLSKVAWVSQHTSLVPGTLRENLLMASSHAGDQDLYAALEQANALEFIQQLPGGLDTRVGDRGVGLSGGQIQRLGLARAFLKNAPVLLLDEPTANLDRESERLVLDALERLCRDRMVLMLTHRRASVLKADEVWRLENGSLSLVEGQPDA